MIAVAVVAIAIGYAAKTRRDARQRKANVARAYLRAYGSSLTPADRAEAEKIIDDSDHGTSRP
jgi:hypothetical protein